MMLVTWKKINLGIDSKYIGKIDFAVSKSEPDRLFVMVEASDGKGGFINLKIEESI